MKILNLLELELHYQNLGEGEAAVLVHGLGSDHSIWAGLIPFLQEEYHIIVPDLRGHGESSKTPGPYTMELFSKDIQGLLKSLDIEKAHFIGHSMGGAILQELVLQKPDIISSLTLISSFAYIDQHLQELLLELRKILTENGYIPFFNRCLQLAHKPEFVNEDLDKITEIRDSMAKTISPDSIVSSINACLKVNYIDCLKQVEKPTLIIAGEADVFIPPYHSIKIKNNIPHSNIEIIPAASHNMLLEQPYDVYKPINELLNNHVI